jgi:hypothetical protein
MTFKVERITFANTGWGVTAAFTNRSNETLRIVKKRFSFVSTRRGASTTARDMSTSWLRESILRCLRLLLQDRRGAEVSAGRRYRGVASTSEWLSGGLRASRPVSRASGTG